MFQTEDCLAFAKLLAGIAFLTASFQGANDKKVDLLQTDVLLDYASNTKLSGKVKVTFRNASGTGLAIKILPIVLQQTGLLKK